MLQFNSVREALDYLFKDSPVNLIYLDDDLNNVVYDLNEVESYLDCKLSAHILNYYGRYVFDSTQNKNCFALYPNGVLHALRISKFPKAIEISEALKGSSFPNNIYFYIYHNPDALNFHELYGYNNAPQSFVNYTNKSEDYTRNYDNRTKKYHSKLDFEWIANCDSFLDYYESSDSDEKTLNINEVIAIINREFNVNINKVTIYKLLSLISFDSKLIKIVLLNSRNLGIELTYKGMRYLIDWINKHMLTD